MESDKVNAADEVRQLRADTKALRQAGAHEDAIAQLEQAIGRFRRAIEGRPDRAIAHALVEAYGMLGGTHRDRSDFRRSAAAYDAGFRYESDPHFDLQSSYNALNRLVSRVLLHPGALTDPDAHRTDTSLESVDVPRALTSLVTTLKAQTAGARKDDPWAAGDLALAAALSGSDADAQRALDHLASTSPPAAVYQAYKQVFEMLARLDTPRQRQLQGAIEWLDARLADLPAP